MYTLLKQEGRARRGQFQTVHGTVQTPAFMNVGTSAAIKGGISSYDLKDLKCQVELCNTYHLHLRPGDEKIIHGLGRSDSHRLGRLPGLFAGAAAHHQRAGRALSVAHRRQKNLHGTGGEHAHPVQPRFDHRDGL